MLKIDREVESSHYMATELCQTPHGFIALISQEKKL